MINSGDETRRGLIPEDLLKFSWLEAIALAPDASQVAYTVRRPDAQRDGYQTDAYLLDLRSGERIRLTIGCGRAGSLAWSRDGKRLAYVWQADGVSAICILRKNGEEIRRFLFDRSAPMQLDWSPDGKRLAFTRWTEMRQADLAPAPGYAAPTIRVVRRLRYKQDGVGWVENRYRQIWTLDLDSGELGQITDDERDYGDPCWSWGGDRIAFTGMAREQNIPLGQGQILIHDVATGLTGLMNPAWPGPSASPQWRADDKAIAFTGHGKKPPVNRSDFWHVWLYDLKQGEARDLTGAIDQQVGNYAVADQRAGLSNVTAKWAGGEGRIAFLLTQQGATHLYSVSEKGDPRLEVGGSCVVFDYSPALDGAVAYGMADPSSPGDLCLLGGEGKAHKRLTQLNRWLGSRQLSVPQEYWYEGLGGARVHAWEMKPVGFEADGRAYPTIVQVHCSMYSWDFCIEFQCLAAAGYVVAYFNQRGTTAGYGQAWTQASLGDQGGGDYIETMLGVDDLVTRPYVDAGRLGVTGGSCGGFMTNWIVGHTHRFAAAVTQRSVSDEVSFFGTSDIGPESGEVGSSGEKPWTNLHAYWRQSPLSAAHTARTPLLIIHSDEDHRCPLGQGEELFAMLRWLGCEVEMVIFQGESHGLSRGGRPGNRIERLRRIKGWFDTHLE